MSKVKLGDYDVVNRNYDYLLLAKKNGFFQDGWDPDDIFTCSDWVVAWWIDELDEKKDDKDRFVREILPTFDVWKHKNRLNSDDVGYNYDFLKEAERNGIEIDDAFVGFVNSFTIKNLLMTKKQTIEDSYEKLYDHFLQYDLIQRIKRWKNSGVPLNPQTAQLYDRFSSLERCGENINFDMFIFFSTLKNELPFSLDDYELLNEKKAIEEKYKTKIISGDEFIGLYNWICHGYNIDAVQKLEKRIENIQKHLAKTTRMDKYLDIINRHVNHDVEVTYTELDHSGKCEIFKLSGKLEEVTNRFIKISYQDEAGKKQIVTILSSDNLFIGRIKLTESNKVLYENRITDEISELSLRKKRVLDIKNANIVDKYIKKYGSITGLAYLRDKAECFINMIDPQKYPINNLFAYCFEHSLIHDEEDVRRVLYTYNLISSGKFIILFNDNSKHSIDEFNDGYPITEYISEKCKYYIYSYCHYNSRVIPQDQLPPLPTDKIDNSDEIVSQNGVSQSDGSEGVQEETFAILGGKRRNGRL